ncbi:DUF4129 domain-containing protein [Halorubellus litoreus]|uniref:DUF4129 domain-containing protein n=1 Tax=Halorubellus litoreus TaxID=755308 RepID=A0ABD5VQB6_9EURY
MNWESVATVAVCVACLFAVSTAATTMESTVTTNPDDVIDIDSSELPIGSESAVEVKSQVQSEGGPGDDGGGQQQSDGGQAAESGSGSGDSTARSAGESEQSSASGGDGGEGSGGDASGDEQESASSGGASGSSSAPSVVRSLLDRLVDVLQWLLGVLGSLLPVAALVTAVALAVRYRDALRAAIRARLADWGLVDSAASEDVGGSATSVRTEPAPETDVAAAWYEFVEALGLGDVRSAAPHECAERAREAGVDASVVEDVNEPFEEVQYGRAPETEERRRRARNGLERFRAQYDGGRD